ncbi:BMP family ABC transporter substrate-binding protein [Isoptericola sp. b490]|uniref:BMP family lipoprotein n=1 Tax=Actinotalea lenta TaxID=3064654 RepID=UPI002712958F|nr:BMP family ABC transporter substrate-binding protein [Isoptericola sp. b490]MDO8121384.1 BMP family ABC transporter substrate-binding protein [Isoptericola sp. b490]
MKTAMRGVALAAATALALAACASAPEESPSSSSTDSAGASETSTAKATDYTACIVSDAGGFDDKSFNQLSYEGTKKAAQELGATFKEAQSDSETDFQPNLEAMVSVGCDTIVSVGFALSAATVESALANPDLQFVLVDDAADNDFNGEKDAPNIKPLLYDTAQAAFLAGYLSAGYSKAGKVGTFGGQPYPTVTIFMDGFKQGVDYYNKVKGTDVKVVGWDGKDGSFTGGFEANDTAKATANNIIGQGVDVLLPVGGPIYQSARDAIADSGKDIALIGVDADVYNTDPSVQSLLLTSIMKNMDVSCYDTIMAAGQGNFDPTAYVGTLSNDGVGIAPLHDYKDKVDPALMDEVNKLKQDIIDGTVKVTSYLNQ